MKSGKTLQELAIELDRQQNSMVDYACRMDNVEFSANSSLHHKVGETDVYHGSVKLSSDAFNELDIQKIAHNQIGTFFGIPSRHYDEMNVKYPDILAMTLNAMVTRNPKKHRMIRTLDGNVRAFLSSGYRRIDNAEVVPVVLRSLMDNQAKVVSSEITDSRVYIKALFPRVEAEVALNDVVQAGIVVTNSEVGLGRMTVKPLIYRLVCKNGMIREVGGISKTHLGRRFDKDINETAVYMKNDTILAQDKAFMLELRDTLMALASPENLAKQIEGMKDAMLQQIKGDVVGAVHVLKKKAALSDDDTSGILRHLISGGDLSKWGLSNAVTRHSQDVQNYDHATDLEALGGKIIDLPKTAWEEISEAKPIKAA